MPGEPENSRPQRSGAGNRRARPDTNAGQAGVLPVLPVRPQIRLNPDIARRAVVMAEIIGPPVSKKRLKRG